MDHSLIAVGVRHIQADGNAVCQTADLSGCRPSINQIAQSVCVQADAAVRKPFPQEGADLLHLVESHHRLSIAAVNNLPAAGKIEAVNCVKNFFQFRLSLKPEVFCISYGIAVASDTEFASAGTAVRNV